MTTRSDRPVIPEGYLDLITGATFAHVATLGPGGEPQSNPVWFDWDGEHIKFSQTTTRQKLRNVNRDPRVALSVIDLGNPYRYLEVRGLVDHIADDPDNDFINAMAKKYIGLDEYPYHQSGDERVVVHVRPQHTTSMG